MTKMNGWLRHVWALAIAGVAVCGVVEIAIGDDKKSVQSTDSTANREPSSRATDGGDAKVELEALGAAIAPFYGRHKTLTAIDFSGSKLAEVPIGLLSGFGRPFVIVLDQPTVSDDDLRRLSELDDCHGVILSKAVITDQGLRYLTKARQMQVVGLYDCDAITDDGIKHLAALSRLQHLKLNGIAITDAAIESVKDLPLVELDLFGINITNEALRYIGQMDQLLFLNLAKTDITDTGVARLSGLKKLYRLQLDDTKLTNAGLPHVGALRELRWLTLPSHITDEGFAHLAGMPHLKDVGVLSQFAITDKALEFLTTLKFDELVLIGAPAGRCQITDAGLKHLEKMTGLKRLFLTNQPITDDGLIALGRVKGLEGLNLNGTKISNAGLDHLKQLDRLKAIQLFDTDVTQRGAEKLRRALPKCVIQWSETTGADPPTATESRTPRSGDNASDGVSDDVANTAAPLVYRFGVGQELRYELDMTTDYLHKDTTYTNHRIARWTFWVVGRNKDGSSRLLSSSSIHTQRGDRERTDNRDFFELDVFPDGRVVLRHASLQSVALLSHGCIFVELPSRQRSRWESVDREHRIPTTFQVDPKTIDNDEITVHAALHSTLHQAANASSSTKTVFNRNRGLVVGSSGNQQQTQPPLKHQQQLELLSVSTQDKEWVKSLVADAGRYFEIVDRNEGIIHAASRAIEVAKCESQLTGASEALLDAKKDVSTNIILEHIDHRRTRLGQMQPALASNAKWRGNLVGKAMYGFDLTDLDGNRHTLEQHRGKVLVLDFWHHKCGPCIMQMPDIIDVYRVTRQQPVAVLGMNTDENAGDARAVADRLKIPFPVLRVDDLYTEFGVATFPTVLVVDSEGIVRDAHIGYSPTTQKELLASIRLLLKTPNHQGRRQ